jgi:DnaK suppressor protein
VTTKKKVSVSEDNEGLTPEQSELLRKKLEFSRDELRRKTKAHLRAATHSDDELSEEADIANRLTDIDDTLGLAEHEQRVLSEVEHALAKFEHGTYGVSELSGEPIPFARLDAIPWARLDAHEAEAEER